MSVMKSIEHFLLEASVRGVKFAIPTGPEGYDSPYAIGAMRYVSPAQLLDYVSDPIGFMADQFGVSKDDYVAWCADEFGTRCHAITRGGRPCRGTYPRTNDPISWLAMGRRQFCPVHERHGITGGEIE